MLGSNNSPVKIDATPELSAPVAAGILRRWKGEDLLNKGLLGLRGVALFFSLISFILVASNKHGGWRDFEKYQEYKYLLAIAILSTLYTGYQVFVQINRLLNGKNMVETRISRFIDFVGDQVVAYLLISSASSAIPRTNRMRGISTDNIFTDSSAAAITMSIFAFICLALSAIISGYKLSAQT